MKAPQQKWVKKADIVSEIQDITENSKGYFVVGGPYLAVDSNLGGGPVTKVDPGNRSHLLRLLWEH